MSFEKQYKFQLDHKIPEIRTSVRDASERVYKSCAQITPKDMPISVNKKEWELYLRLRAALAIIDGADQDNITLKNLWLHTSKE